MVVVVKGGLGSDPPHWMLPPARFADAFLPAPQAKTAELQQAAMSVSQEQQQAALDSFTPMPEPIVAAETAAEKKVRHRAVDIFCRKRMGRRSWRAPSSAPTPAASTC